MADKRDILINLLGKETVSPAATKAAAGIDKLGDEMRVTERAAADLDRQIEDVQRSLRDLAVQSVFGEDVTRQIREQERELRRLTKLRGRLDFDIGDAGTDAAEKFGVQFVQRVGPLIARAPLGPAGAALGAIIGVPLAAGIGAAAAAGVLGGAGAGGVIGGITIAAKDARVRAAGAELGAQLSATLENSATAFVPATIHAIGIIKSELGGIGDELEGTFNAAANYVAPLTRGVTGLVRNALPGIRTAVEAAGPIIRELSEGLPRIGDAIGDVLRDISGDADTGTSAVRGLMMGLESGIRTVGAFVGGLADLYRALVATGQAGATFAEGWAGWLPFIGDKLGDNKAKMDQLAAALETGGDKGEQAGESIFGGFQRAAEGAAAATAEVETFAATMDRITQENLDARSATREMEAAIDDATAALKENGKTLDENTPKGRANAAALDALAAKTNAAYQATLAQTGSQQAANEVLNRGRDQFIKLATSMGMSKEAAKRLADQLFALPDRNVAVNVDTKKAMERAKAISDVVNGIKSKDITIGVYWTSKGDLKLPGGTSLKGLSAGGPVDGPGPKGRDSLIRALAPGEHVLTAQEVDAAGGHGAIEQWRKSLVSGGSRPAPAMAMAGTAQPVAGGGNRYYSITVNVPPTASPAEVGRATVEAIKAYERSNGSRWRQ